jgi:hypothetical protein
MTPDARRADSIRWLLSRLGPPGEEQGRKRELLEHVRRIFLRDLGRVPVWWCDLRDEVREGRL